MSFTTAVSAQFAAFSASFLALPLAAQIAIGVGVAALLAGMVYGIYLLATVNKRAVNAKLKEANVHIDLADAAFKAGNTKDYKNELVVANNLLLAVKESKDDLKPNAKQVIKATEVLEQNVAPKLTVILKAEAAADAAANAVVEEAKRAESTRVAKETELMHKADVKLATENLNNVGISRFLPSFVYHKTATVADIAAAKAAREAKPQHVEVSVDGNATKVKVN